MTNFFKKFRKKTLSGGKVTAYLSYAAGEIILVMIGILLALQVNNCNERVQMNRELDNIFMDVKLDLEQDTLIASHIISFYELSQETSQKVIDGEITKENIAEHPMATSLVTIYQSLSIQQKGYGLLNDFTSSTVPQKDTLVTNIGRFYSTYLHLIENSKDFVKTDVFKNLDAFRDKPWFVDWSQGRQTDDMLTYFTTSEDYKKRVAAHKILAADAHLRFIETYKYNATELLRQINSRLDTGYN